MQLLVPGTRADNHLFWREGFNLGSAGWLDPVPLGMGVSHRDRQQPLGSCLLKRQQPWAPTCLFCSHSRPEISHIDNTERPTSLCKSLCVLCPFVSWLDKRKVTLFLFHIFHYKRNKNYICFRCTTWWIDINIHNKRSTILKLIKIPSLHIVIIFVCDEST